MIVKDIPISFDGAFSQKMTAVLVPGDVQAYRIVYKTPFDLTGASFSVTALREDGSAVTDVGTVSENTGYYTLKNSMYSQSGLVTLRLTINGTDGVALTAKELVLDVAEGVETDVGADDRVPALNSLIAQAQSAANKAENAANTATEAAENVDSAISLAQEAAGNANTAAGIAENAAQKAEDAAEQITVDISIDSTITGEPGTAALVENLGTQIHPNFQFTIPRGAQGEKGERGDSGITTPNNGFFTVYVNEAGHLIAVVADNAVAPPLSIVDGHLIYTI